LKNNPGKTRDDYDIEVAKIVLRKKPDVVVLAGWMHVLGDGFLEAMTSDTLPERAILRTPVINIHPALPGAFDGTNAIRRAYDAFQRGEITKSGVMVHRVVKEVDRGEPIIVREVMMKEGESFEDFAARMHEAEWQVIVEATAKVLEQVTPGEFVE
jgi:phosphoribosylglycinamide formyltransferase